MADKMTAYRALADTLSQMVESDAITIDSDEYPNGREYLAEILATIAGLDPDPTPGKKKAHTWNPQKWTDPDEVGSSEYRVMHELATDVWESNSGHNNTDRAGFVEGSIQELHDIVKAALENGGCN